MENEFSKQKHMREVVFKKDYRVAGRKSGPVRFAKGSTHYMHKDVAKKVAAYADINEINWKKIHGDAKKLHDSAVKKKESA